MLVHLYFQENSQTINDKCKEALINSPSKQLLQWLQPLLKQGHWSLLELCEYNDESWLILSKNFEHLDEGVDFDLLEDFDYNINVQFKMNEIVVLINGKKITSFKRPKYLIGRVGLRAWRCQVNIQEFKIRNIK